jgi:NifB/MoaA-like Fe-S oxidoreductase
VRDEDIRLSFLYGNYTTLSSITPDEMKRIVEQRLSPQYVSIHATDLETRAYLLGVPPERADIADKLRTLLDNDIELHAQIVLCPEINDGKILEKTLRDLAAEYPKVVSTAIVPVALTRYNTDDRLTRVTPEFCQRTITEVEKLQKEFRKTLGVTFAHLGDEIYVKAGAEIPSRRMYGNYPQIEDGVGMIRSFLNTFESLMKRRSKTVKPAKNVRTHPSAIKPRFADLIDAPEEFEFPKTLNGTILTGEMFAPFLAEQIDRYNAVNGTTLGVKAVPNTYFGGDVSVAGLLSGRDFLAVADQIEGEFVIIPKHTVKSDEPIMIDGMAFDELKERFPLPLIELDMDGLIALLS